MVTFTITRDSYGDFILRQDGRIVPVSSAFLGGLCLLRGVAVERHKTRSVPASLAREAIEEAIERADYDIVGALSLKRTLEEAMEAARDESPAAA